MSMVQDHGFSQTIPVPNKLFRFCLFHQLEFRNLPCFDRAMFSHRCEEVKHEIAALTGLQWVRSEGLEAMCSFKLSSLWILQAVPTMTSELRAPLCSVLNLHAAHAGPLIHQVQLGKKTHGKTFELFQ